MRVVNAPRARSLWIRVRDDLWGRPDGNFAALDGMRGFASVIIVFFHCALFIGALSPESVARGRFVYLRHFLNGFWSGIDIFFVLSGFLIGRILITDLFADGRLYFRSFFLRRAFRIFPAYYLVLTLSILLISRHPIGPFYYLFGSNDWSVLSPTVWTHYIYVNNYLYPGNVPSVFSWGWSLCVEEHFYALLPPLLWLLFRGPKWLPPIGLVACVLAPLAGRAVQFARDPDLRLLHGFYYFSHNRFDEIFIGVILAYMYVCHFDGFRTLVRRTRGALAWTGAFFIGIVWCFGGLFRTGSFAVVFQFFVLALGSGMLLLNGLFLNNWATRFFSHRIWYPLARISYGTYLLHPFVLFGLLAIYARYAPIGEIRSLGVVVLYVLVMALTTVVAAAMFVLLERPMLDAGMAWSRRIKAEGRRQAGALANETSLR
jgi:peptidoglycan/LPS O-acetylase OafA/YrhL